MAAQQIVPIDITPEKPERRWGVKIHDYQLDGAAVDFETLLVKVSCRRATVVEKQIGPVSKIVTRRNAQLKDLGDALADLSRAQAKFTEKSSPTDTQSVSSRTATIVNALASGGETIISGTSVTKANCEMAIQLVKAKMEKHNNDSQNDTTRLQGLISKRDGAFDTASSLLKHVSDARGNSIRNMLIS